MRRQGSSWQGRVTPILPEVPIRLVCIPTLIAAGALLAACAPPPDPAVQPDVGAHGYEVEVHNNAPEAIDFYYQDGRDAPVLLGSVAPQRTERFQFTAGSVQRLSARPSDGVGAVECRSDAPEPDALIQVNCSRDARVP